MKKVILLSMIVVLSFGLFGCDDNPNRKIKDKESHRFIYTGQDFYIDGDTNIRIVEDTETKILYLAPTGNGFGMTPWLDKDGKVMKAED